MNVTDKSYEQYWRRLLQAFAPDRAGFAVLVLVVLSLLFTYPTIFQLSTHLIGGTADGWQFPWNSYVFRERILAGKDPYFTDDVFYPLGVSLHLHGYTEFNDVIGLLLSPFFNDVAITNLMVLLATVLSGMGMYVLAKELTGNSLAALFAGIAFAFCPFRMIRLIGHTHMALTQFLPFALWAFFKMGQTLRLRYAFFTALFFALATYCNYYFTIYLIVAFALLLVYGLVRFPAWRSAGFLKLLIVTGTSALVFLFPILLHVLTLLRQGTMDTYAGRPEFLVEQSADVLEYLKLAPTNQLLQEWLGQSPVVWPYSRLTTGWMILIFGIPGMIQAFRNRKEYLLLLSFMGFGFLLLSLGPYFEIESFRIPLPYSGLIRIPFLGHARIPDRFAVMVNLVTMVLAAYGLSLLLNKISTLRARNLFTLAVFGLLCFELASFPFPMEAFDPPQIFYTLGKNKKSQEAMISLPFSPGNIRAKKYMGYQTIHRQKLLDGRVSRNPWLPMHYFDTIPVAHTLGSMSKGVYPRDDVIELDRKAAPLFRQFYDVRYLALFPRYVNRPQVQRYVNLVFPDARILSEENEIKFYYLPPPELKTFLVNKDDPAMPFFLLENWKVDRNGYRIVSKSSEARLMLPGTRRDQLLRLKMILRTRSRQAAQTQLTVTIGNEFVGQGSLESVFRPLKIDIPGDRIHNSGRVATLKLTHEGNPGGENLTMELRSIEGVFIAAHP